MCVVYMNDLTSSFQFDVRPYSHRSYHHSSVIWFGICAYSSQSKFIFQEHLDQWMNSTSTSNFRYLLPLYLAIDITQLTTGNKCTLPTMYVMYMNMCEYFKQKNLQDYAHIIAKWNWILLNLLSCSNSIKELSIVSIN